MLSKVNSGRAVCTADNADRGGLFKCKTGKYSACKGDKYPELSAGPYDKGLGIGYQRPKICHGAKAKEYYTGDYLPLKP
jgi:hypothetical protein